MGPGRIVIGNARSCHHALHNEKLLIILLAEDRHVRQALQEKFRDDRRDPRKKMRPGNSLERLREAGHLDARREVMGVNLVDLRRVHGVGLNAQKLMPVAFFVARIARKILVRRELRGVHEDGNDNAVCVLFCELDEGEMAVVEAAHCGNKRNALTAPTPLLYGLAQLCCKTDNR